MPHLSSADLALASEASRVLLAPMRYEGVDEWRADVNRVLVRLLRADSAGFLLPVVDRAPMFSEEHSAQSLAPFPDLLPPDTKEGVPIWERTLQLRHGTLAMAYGDSMSEYLRSEYYNDFAAAGGGAETLFAALPLSTGVNSPIGAASLHLWHARGSRRQFGEREIALLGLLIPSFTAGVESWQRFGCQPNRLPMALHEPQHAMMICDRHGRLLHASTALTRLLADDAEASLVLRAMEQLARTAACPASTVDQMRAAISIRTLRRRYQASWCAGPDSAEGPVIHVSLSSPAVSPATRTPASRRETLTPQEQRVANLLAEGCRNGEIARRLDISEHTVKRHVEQVMRKLRIASRAGAARALDRLR